MNLDKANLLLVQYEGGDLYLISSSFFSQDKFTAYGEAEVGQKDVNGLLKIELKVVESAEPSNTFTTPEVLQPAVHIVNLGSTFSVVQKGQEYEIDGEIEVDVLLGRADDPNSFIENQRRLNPSKVKRITAGGDARPIED